MFDIGFSEMILVAVLALVVLGPDKLPELGKKLGEFYRAFQQSKRDIQTSLYNNPPTPADSSKNPNSDKQIDHDKKSNQNIS